MMKRIIYDYKNPHIVGRAKGSLRIGRLIIGIIVVSLVVARVYILFFRKGGYRRETREYFVAVAGHYQTENEAVRAAAELRLRGGGGYVVEKSGYSVIAAAYESEDDAVKVAERYGYSVEGTGSFIIYEEGELIELCTLPERIFSSLSTVADDLDRGMLSSDAAAYAVEEAQKAVALEKEKAPAGEDKTSVGINKMLAELISALEAGGRINLRYCLIDIAYTYRKFLIYIS